MSIFRYNALSSANSLILEVRLFSMSFIYRRKRSGPSTVPWGTPDVTICVSEWEPLRVPGEFCLSRRHLSSLEYGV